MHVVKILVPFTDNEDFVLLSRVQSKTYLFSSVLIVLMENEDIAKNHCKKIHIM